MRRRRSISPTTERGGGGKGGRRRQTLCGEIEGTDWSPDPGKKDGVGHCLLSTPWQGGRSPATKARLTLPAGGVARCVFYPVVGLEGHGALSPNPEGILKGKASARAIAER